MVLIAVALCAFGAPQRTPKRKIACKTPENAASCYWTRGRLAVYNGGPPNIRVWKIGTKRILGIESGPNYNEAVEEENGPDLPPNVLRVLEPHALVFADFEVCPLEAARPRHMQHACIEAAKNIVVR